MHELLSARRARILRVAHQCLRPPNHGSQSFDQGELCDEQQRKPTPPTQDNKLTLVCCPVRRRPDGRWDNAPEFAKIGNSTGSLNERLAPYCARGRAAPELAARAEAMESAGVLSVRTGPAHIRSSPAFDSNTLPRANANTLVIRSNE